MTEHQPTPAAPVREAIPSEAGPAMDSLVAIRVFGRQHLVGDQVPVDHRHASEPVEAQEEWLGSDGAWCRLCGDLPSFSADIAAAFLVVETMRERGVFIDVDTMSAGYGVIAGWEGRANEDIWMVSEQYHAMTPDELPLAICRAALAAHSLTGDPTDG